MMFRGIKAYIITLRICLAIPGLKDSTIVTITSTTCVADSWVTLNKHLDMSFAKRHRKRHRILTMLSRVVMRLTRKRLQRTKIAIGQNHRNISCDSIVVLRTNRLQTIQITHQLSLPASDVDALFRTGIHESCYGRIRIIVPKTDSGSTTVHIRALEPLELQHDQILIQFSDNCHHPSRERKPIPKSIREFIKNPAHASQTAAEMFRKILNAVVLGRLQNIDMNDVTDDNVRYWWSQIRKKEYERDKDPWVSAVMYLREQSDVTVYSFIDERRRYFCWYYPCIFDVDLTTVTEVYIDSTHGTNGQNAELFGIIACENGYGVPIGYMLMEKKPNEDSRLFPGEVIEACTRFFYHAKELGLNPIIIHTDKSAAEIAAIKVSISVLQTDDRLMLAGPTQRLAFAHGMWKRIFENG